MANMLKGQDHIMFELGLIEHGMGVLHYQLVRLHHLSNNKYGQ
uniref:Uncharacterized protein n=1 Tax=Arundo donax TaxID=35708 RepID=A0A0A9GWS8_ARUDO